RGIDDDDLVLRAAADGGGSPGEGEGVGLALVLVDQLVAHEGMPSAILAGFGRGETGVWETSRARARARFRDRFSVRPWPDQPFPFPGGQTPRQEDLSWSLLR